MRDGNLLADLRGVVLGVSGEDSVGYHTARAFRALGAEVTITHQSGRRETVGPHARALGVDTVELDVRDERAVEQAMDEIGRGYERLHFIVHIGP